MFVGGFHLNQILSISQGLGLTEWVDTTGAAIAFILGALGRWISDAGVSVPLAVAAIGLLGTLLAALATVGGILFTQFRADVRERDRIQQDREWQREAWAKDHRRAAHMAFLAEQRRLDHMMMMYTRVGLDGLEAPREDWSESLGRLLLDVQVFGSQEAAVAAQRLYRATQALESGAVGDMARADEAIETYRRLVQRDLGLKETNLPAWGLEDANNWSEVGES